MRPLTALSALIFIAAATPASAAVKNCTCYLDGAVIEGETAAVKGYMEIRLPASMKEGSFRIRPSGSAVIERIKVVSARSDSSAQKRIGMLEERKSLLDDRLRALDTREEIFKAAAKSQSAKAPRKSKTNPEPLASVRQGTAFAMAQLEEVFRLRRRAEHEAKEIESEIAALRKEGKVGGSVAKVWMRGRDGRARYSYLLPASWTPLYDFRLEDGDILTVTIRGDLPQLEKGARAAVVLSDIAGAGTPRPARGESPAEVATYRFPLKKRDVIAAPLSSAAFAFTNVSQDRLPAGDAAVFWKGEYLGTVRFPGSAPGETKEVTAGR